MKSTMSKRRGVSRRTSRSPPPPHPAPGSKVARCTGADEKFGNATRCAFREDEKAFLETLQESISKGTTWERITDLVDLQNSRKSSISLIPFVPSPLCCRSELPQGCIPMLTISRWSFICHPVESKTLRASVPGGSDLARMKEILLSLRREGEKAPAAGGY